MMRSKTTWISLALLLAALLAVPALAATETKEKALHLTGEVVSINASDGSVTVRGSDEASSTFQVNASTQITRDGKTIKLDGLAQGDKVTVTYEKQAQANVAVMIGVMSSGKA